MGIKIPSIVSLLFFSSVALSDADGERAALAKIIHELNALEPLIIEAKAQSDHDARVQFEYDWMTLDINRIKSGIKEHITAPRTQPRRFPPLKGDYRH